MVSQQPTELPSNPERRNFLQYSLGTLFGITTLTALGVQGVLTYKRHRDISVIRPYWDELKREIETHKVEKKSFYALSELSPIRLYLEKRGYSLNDISSIQERIEILQPNVKEFSEEIIDRDEGISITREEYARTLEEEACIPKGSLGNHE